MNARQRSLVEKTLGVAGWMAVAILALVLLSGFGSYGGRFMEDIFDSEEAAPIVWPLFIAAATLLWARAYMRAGKEQ